MDRAKLEALAKQLRATAAKLTDQLDALDAVLAEEATPNQIAKGLVGDFIIAWGVRYPGQTCHVANWGKEITGFKRLMKTMSVNEIQMRIVRYIGSQEHFYSGARHPLGLFFTSVNKFGDVRDQDLLSAPAVACQHRPRCGSDQACTARSARELRA